MKFHIKLCLLFLFVVVYDSASAQYVPVYNFEQFKPILDTRNDTTYVINFWATWCKPCVKEMPDLLKAHTKFKDEKFKLVLVSLDFDTHLNSKVIPFMNDYHIESQVILLNDSKQHEWIDKVNEAWSGAIPVTIIFNKDFYFFREGEITFDELDELIKKNINQ